MRGIERRTGGHWEINRYVPTYLPTHKKDTERSDTEPSSLSAASGLARTNAQNSRANIGFQQSHSTLYYTAQGRLFKRTHVPYGCRVDVLFNRMFVSVSRLSIARPAIDSNSDTSRKQKKRTTLKARLETLAEVWSIEPFGTPSNSRTSRGRVQPSVNDGLPRTGQVLGKSLENGRAC